MLAIAFRLASSKQAWLRQLRGEAPPRLSAFSLAVCFTLAGIQRFEQPVTGGAAANLVLTAQRSTFAAYVTAYHGRSVSVLQG